MGACCCGMSETSTDRDRPSRPRVAARSRGEVVEDVPNVSVRLTTHRFIVVHVPRQLVQHHRQGRATAPGEAVGTCPHHAQQEERRYHERIDHLHHATSCPIRRANMVRKTGKRKTKAKNREAGNLLKCTIITSKGSNFFRNLFYVYHDMMRPEIAHHYRQHAADT